MNSMRKHNRWVAGTVLAAILVASVAPAANADRGRRYRGDDRPVYQGRVIYRDYGPGSTYIVRRSSAGPAIAGFLGGLFLGVVLANAAPAGYVYYDPYCHEEFASLAAYRAHSFHHRHSGVLRVIAIDSGRCAGTYRYSDGGWHPWDGYRGDGDDRNPRDRDDD
jgi:hypothetical protein